jgi:transcriptional regulator with XRE-family HTH domain
MLNARQIRAGRALLGLSQGELAKRAKVGIATLQRMEQAVDEARGAVRTLVKLQTALEAAGVIFIDADHEAGPGVRLR